MRGWMYLGVCIIATWFVYGEVGIYVLRSATAQYLEKCVLNNDMIKIIATEMVTVVYNL